MIQQKYRIESKKMEIELIESRKFGIWHSQSVIFADEYWNLRFKTSPWPMVFKSAAPASPAYVNPRRKMHHAGSESGSVHLVGVRGNNFTLCLGCCRYLQMLQAESRWERSMVCPGGLVYNGLVMYESTPWSFPAMNENPGTRMVHSNSWDLWFMDVYSRKFGTIWLFNIAMANHHF